MSNTIADLVVRLNSDVSGLTRGMSKVKSELKGAEAQAKSSGKGFSAAGTMMSAGLIAGAVALTQYALKCVDTYKTLGLQVSKTAMLLGTGGPGASKLIGEFQMTAGMSADASKQVAFFTKTLGNAEKGAKAPAAVFQRLGISLENSNGTFRDSSAILEDLRNALSEEAGTALFASDAATTLGRGYATLLPWLTKSQSAMDAVDKTLKNMGFNMSDAELAKFRSFIGDERQYAVAQELLQFKIGEFVGELESHVIPAFTDLVGWITKVPTPLLVAAGAFVAVAGALKGFLVIKSIVTELGTMLGLFGKDVAGLTAETAAVDVNTAAWAANDAARAGAGVATGIGVGATSLEAGGAVMAGSAAAGGVTASSFALPAAILAAGVLTTIWASSGPDTSSQGNKNRVAAGIQSQGRNAGSVPYDAATAAANAAKMAPINAAWQQFAVIAQHIKDAKPGPEGVGELQKYSAQLKALEIQYPVVATQADKLIGSLDKSAGAFDSASQSIIATAEATRTAFHSMADFIHATIEAAVTGKPLPTPGQAAYASQSDQATAAAKLAASIQSGKVKWHAPANAGSGPFHAGQSGIRKRGDTVIHTHVHLDGKEIAHQVSRRIMQGVSRQMVGQNA